MTQPLVSVVIAVRNGEAFLAEALDSVSAQTWPAFEVLVVDGRSTDHSREIARAYPAVRVLLQEGTGFAGAWNEGIRAGRGAYVAILDSDDVWEPTKLARQVAVLEAHPTCGYALAHARLFLVEGAPIPPGFARVDLDKDHAAPFPSVLLARRSLFDDVGFFDERWSLCSDVEWFRRVYDRGTAGVMLPDVLMRRRLHANNLSHYPPDPSAFNRELLSILKASLDQRRRAVVGRTPPP